MKKQEYDDRVKLALDFFKRAGIVIREDEEIEVADFGLGEVDKIGLELCVFVNTDRVCAKEMVLFPWQCCPEHKHVGCANGEGKEETFRCRYGRVYLYVEGEGRADAVSVELPKTDVTVYKEVVLNPGEQYTIMPGTKHWFVGGAMGAVVSEFSTTSTDETDVFTDPRIRRQTVIED